MAINRPIHRNDDALEKNRIWRRVQTVERQALPGGAGGGGGGHEIQDEGILQSSRGILDFQGDAVSISDTGVKLIVSVDATTTAELASAVGLLIPKSLVDQKGDILVGTANDTVVRKAAGANGKVLAADSSQPDGLAWVDMGGAVVEAWHVVGAAGEPAFVNSWVSYDGDTVYNSPRFYKDPFGIVHIAGMMAGGTLGGTAFVLPAGYRPRKQCLFGGQGSAGGSGTGRIDVHAAGNVVTSGGANGWYSLDGITFRAEN